MVRGFWGDLVQSPYIPFSEIWKEPEATMFKKQINFQSVYSAGDFCMFNIQNYITILEDLSEYHFPFSRIKKVEEELDNASKATAAETDDTVSEVPSNLEEEKKAEEPQV